jgi:2-iminobutanoate/2-iminopropanoate deaminase
VLRRVVATNVAPAAIGPYSQAIQAGGFVFCSGQIPLDPKSGAIVSGSVAEQTRRVLENLRAVLAAAGCSCADVVKTTIYLTDLSSFGEVNAVYGEFFAHDPPARATVEVRGLPRGAAVEIEAIALVPA